MTQPEILIYIQNNLDEAISLLETLGKIPAPSHFEEQRAEFCRNWLIEQGAEKVWIDSKNNVICDLDCDQHDEWVVFMAHTDIVFEDMTDLPIHRDGNILFAPGIGDDTSNLVNLLMGAKYLIQNKVPMKKGILIVANACEEGLGNLEGSREVFDTFGSRISACYSFDGYLGQCTSIPVGSDRYKITVSGEGGHSYLDFGNDSAIHTMACLIQDLYQIEVPTQEKTTFNVGCINGGSTVNSIAQQAEALYEYRSASQECMNIMKSRFYGVVDSFNKDMKRIEVSLLGHRPGMGEIDMDKLNAWTTQNIKIIRKYYTGPMNLTPQSTDSNIPLSRGLIANTIGTIAGGNAHKREEWVDLDSLPTGMGIVMDLIAQYMK